MKQLIVVVLTIAVATCSAQEPIIIDKTKIDWKNYSELFQDSSKTKFVDKFSFLENVDMYEITYLSDGLKIESFAAGATPY